MYQIGDIRRKNRKRLKQRIIFTVSIIIFVAISYLLFTRSGTGYEGMPDTIVTVEDDKNKLASKKEVADTIEIAGKVSATEESPIEAGEHAMAKEETQVSKPESAIEKTSTQTLDTPLYAAAKPVETKSEPAGDKMYKVNSVAYFYNQPDESTKRKAFINHWNNSYASLTPLGENKDFIYVVFTNHLGQTSKGWLRKKDLNEIKSVAVNNKE